MRMTDTSSVTSLAAHVKPCETNVSVQVQRICSCERLNVLACVALAEYTNPVTLLQRALEDVRVFVPDEVASVIDILLDATLLSEAR